MLDLTCGHSEFVVQKLKVGNIETKFSLASEELLSTGCFSKLTKEVSKSSDLMNANTHTARTVIMYCDARHQPQTLSADPDEIDKEDSEFSGMVLNLISEVERHIDSIIW